MRRRYSRLQDNAATAGESGGGAAAQEEAEEGSAETAVPTFNPEFEPEDWEIRSMFEENLRKAGLETEVESAAVSETVN